MTIVKGMIYERAFLSGSYKNVFIPNAKVIFQPDVPGAPTMTADTQLTGTYQVNLPPGNYHLRIERDEYITFDTRDRPNYYYSVRPGGTQINDFELKPGTEHVVTKSVELGLMLYLEGHGSNPSRVSGIPASWTLNLTREIFDMPKIEDYEHDKEGDPKVTANASLENCIFSLGNRQATCTLDLKADNKATGPLYADGVQLSTKNGFDVPDGGKTISGNWLTSLNQIDGKFIRLVGRTVIRQPDPPLIQLDALKLDGKAAVIAMSVIFRDDSHLS